ncbi:MAG: DUF58 domain-containing protein [Planctomycetales bacterium]|nr:DUF58 domain-containing protein [Planctomycetales bacterium]
MATLRTKPLYRYRLTRLGFHFLFIALFAIIGGSFRGFNLLLLLAGLLIAVVIVQWRQGRGAIRQIHLHRHDVTGTFAGIPFTIRYEIRNVGRWIPLWSIRVEDHVATEKSQQSTGRSGRDSTAARTRVGDRLDAEELSGNGESLGKGGLSVGNDFGNRQIPLVASVGNLPAGQTRTTSIICRFNHRGRYRLGPVVASTTFPFCLMSCEHLTSKSTCDLYVYPRLIELRRGWDALLPPRRGGDGNRSTGGTNHDGEFFGLRPWQSGDHVKHIHWRTTARIDQPAVRQFEQRNRHQICVIVDMVARRNTHYQDATERVLQLATTLLCELATQTRSVALLVADSIEGDPDVCNDLQRSNGANISQLLQRLAVSQPAAIRRNAQDRLEQIVVASAHQLMQHDLVVVSSRSLEDVNRVRSGSLHHRQLQSIWRFFDQTGRLSWMNVNSKNVRRFVGDTTDTVVGSANRRADVVDLIKESTGANL